MLTAPFRCDRLPFAAAVRTMLLLILLVPVGAKAQFVVTEKGKAACVILTQPGATSAEKHAAGELANTLKQITGAPIPVRDTLPTDPGQPVIIVGPGTAAAARFPEIDLSKFRGEEVIRRVKGKTLLLAGGRPRGTTYAVSRFLQEEADVRWWSPWAASIPLRPTFRINRLNVREEPAFEYRESFWYSGFDGDWASRNFSNGHMPQLTEAQGGKITYAGPQFVHTFHMLVPEDPYFAQHPEWFSLRGGKRVGGSGAQLCLTNQALKDFVVTRVREWLKAAPTSRIVSISQNDNVAFCECPECKALDDREGSHAGSLLAFVNSIAETLEPEFPGVAYDTLAYQYTRRPPRTLRPRPSVIIRLCSIEANFAEPFTHKSNAAFADDLADWSKICSRLYVWDYTTNFRHYTQPHPNWFTLGDNIRLFHKSNVRGVFSQGAYQSNGAEMAEMRAWVLARLMWNPKQNDQALIAEFLNGYYGEKAAPFIQVYMKRFEKNAEGFNLTCYTGSDTPFFSLASLAEADRYWEQAEAAVENDPEKLWRVRQGRLPIQYAILNSWQRLRLEALRKNANWPFLKSRKMLASYWLSVATGPGPTGRTPLTFLNEGGLTPQAFAQGLSQDPAPPMPPPQRRGNSAPPADIASVPGSIDVSDALASLFQEGDLSDFRADAAAADGAAVRIAGHHTEWAFQIPVARLPKRILTGRWKVYVSARIDLKSTGGSDRPESAAFQAGVYDTKAAVHSALKTVPMADTAGRYQSYLLGTVDLNSDQYIWVSPQANPAVDAVWVDRVYLVPEKVEAVRQRQ